MTTNPKGYMKKYRRKLRLQLIENFGNGCMNCTDRRDLEFAHIKPTKLNGQSRGKIQRLYDIKNNPDCYILLCKECHYQLDCGLITLEFIFTGKTFDALKEIAKI